jgi:hypothetical protein
MATDTFSCPECQVKLRRSPQLQPGTRVQCPRCQLQFPVPPPEEEEPPAEPGRATAGAYSDSPMPGAGRPEPPREADQDRDRDRAWGEHVSTEPSEERRPEGEPRRWAPPSDMDEDYAPAGRPEDLDELARRSRVDLGAWFSIAKEHWGIFLGPTIGYVLIVVITVGIVNQVLTVPLNVLGTTGTLPQAVVVIAGGLVGLGLEVLLQGPLFAGVTAVSLLQLKGRRWAFGDYFAALRKYGSVVIVSLVRALLNLPFTALGVYFAFRMQTMQAAMAAGPPPAPGTWPPGMPSMEELLILWGAGLGYLLVYLYFYVRLFSYAVPLIYDRDFSGLEALAGSWKLSTGRFWPLLGVAIVTGIVNALGFVLCCVGLLFTYPLTVLVYSGGYLLVGGTEPPVSVVRRRDPDEDY